MRCCSSRCPTRPTRTSPPFPSWPPSPACSRSARASPPTISRAGSPAAVTALLRGDVQMAVLPAASVAPLAAEGKLKLLAVTSPKRSKLLPDLPTLREAGIAGVEADAWVGLIAPAGTSEAVLARINKEVLAVLADPAVVEKLRAQLMV